MASLALAFDVLARDRASRVFNDVGNAAERAGRKGGMFGSVVSKSAGIAGKSLLGLGAAAGVGMGAAAKWGLNVASQNEQAEISFTTMLGSAQKAQAFLSKMQQFAATTPFEFPELQTAASSLISAGVNADKVIPIMRTLGDVTSGMGTGSEGVKRATIALQQMNAAGRITGEDLNQLRDAGIPVYDLLASATGKSKAEVVKLAQAGKLGQKELGQMMKALETGKGLERFSGLMDKQSKSLSGMLSTFKDTFGQGLANAIKPSIPLIKDGLGKASEFAAKALPKVGAALAGLVSILVKGDFTKEFGKAFNIDEDSKIVGFLFGVRDGFTAAAATVKEFVGQVKSGQGAGGAFRDNLAKIVDVAKELWPSLRDIAKQLLEAQRSVGVGVWAAFKVVMDVLPGILQSIAPVLQSIAKWMGENKEIVAALVVALSSGIGAFKVITAAVKAYTVVQGLLNVVLAANPIGIVIAAIAALTAGIIYAYQHSETFRNIVNTAFEFVKKGAIALALVGVKSFHFLLDVWLTVAGGILDAAAWAFGWVPGLGPKLQGAAANFHKFKDQVNGSLSKIETDLTVQLNTEPARRAADSLAKYVRTRNYSAVVRTITPQTSKLLIGANARGTDNWRGGLTVVGEEGPEIVNLPRGSQIYDAQKSAAMMSSAGPASSGYSRLHPHDIEALAAAITRQPATAVVSQRNMMNAIGGAL